MQCSEISRLGGNLENCKWWGTDFGGRPLRIPGIPQEETMNGLIYLIGLIVVIMFILSFLGLR